MVRKTETIALLIPAFKPTEEMLRLLERLRKLDPNILILIVNDGSPLECNYLFEKAAQINNLFIVSHISNLGKGAAIKTGINYLLVHFPGLQSIVTADADGQHDPEDIINIAAISSKSPGDLILGYRTFDQDIPWRSKIGNKISMVVYKYLLGLQIKDTQTGLRGIPKQLAFETLNIKSNKYELETEQLVITARKKIGLQQIPIKTIYEDNNSSSHFNPFFDSIRIYYSLLRYTIASLITAIADFLAFLLFSSLTGNIITSNLFSRYVALLLQYLLIKKFVFKSEGSISKLIQFFGIVSLTGLISGVLQKELVASTGISVVLSKIIVDSGLFIFNFLFLRDILFRKEDID